MSEIFKWLKRTEIQGQSRTANAASQSVEVISEPDPVTVEAEPVNDFPREAPSHIEVLPDACFDLALANRQLRMVFDPVTLVGEHFRILRSKLDQMQKRRPFKVLLVTSSVPGEGKTFTACCLAGVLAQEPGKRVLLIDSDLRKPRVGRELGIREIGQPEGLSNILRGEKQIDDVIHKANNIDLFLLPSGPTSIEPVELLENHRLERTIKAASKLFDWVVIDSPPVIGLADATILASVADTVIMVIHSGKTPARVIKESIARIGSEKICGLVMNRGKQLRNSKYYYHYYRKDAAHNPKRK